MDWIERARINSLELALNAAGLTEDQRLAVRKVDQALALRGAATTTRTIYASRAKQLGLFLKKPFEQATREDVTAYLNDCRAKFDERTLTAFKSFLRRFYTILLGGDEGALPPVVSWIRFHVRRGSQKLPKDLVTPDDVKRLAEACVNPRDRAVVMVLYDSAARVSEFCGLRIGDVEFDQYGARISVNGKTGPRKIRLIHSVPDLRAWINFHPWRGDKDAPLFVHATDGVSPKPLMQDGVGRVLDAAVRTVRLKKRVYPHLLRHSRLTELAKQLSESELKVFAGWVGDSDMARVYIHLSGDDVDRKVLEKAGLLTKEEVQKANPLVSKQCLRCSAKNSPADELCSVCNAALDEQTFRAVAQEQDKLHAKLPALLDVLEDEEVTNLVKYKLSQRRQEKTGRPRAGTDEKVT